MLGPSVKNVCRVVNRSSCGSGSIVGIRNGRTLILTNAHVAGSRIGREVQVEVESLNYERITARIIMAAYNDKTLADWAVLETVNEWSKIAPVKLSKDRPTGSHYTKGFPRCRPFAGSDISTVDQSDSSPLWRWRPNSIGGQSGSGVWSDSDNLQYGLLTWSWGGLGAGQMTSEIYRQARNRTTAGYARPEGLEELVDDRFDLDSVDRSGCDDPILENGFFQQTNITSLPIWAEDDLTPDPGNGGDGFDARKYSIENHRQLMEYHEKQMLKLQGMKTPITDPGEDIVDDEGGGIFGL